MLELTPLPDEAHSLANDPHLAKLRKWQGDSLILGGVVLKQRLGEGGMGRVYLGQHTRLGLPVAVKILKEPSPQHLQLFLREARLTARLEHPNLVRIYDVNTDRLSGIHYLVMEYVEGGSVYEVHCKALKRKRFVSRARVVEIVQHAALALGEAHRQGIVHRDMKPDNILLRRSDGRIKVTDLGLAVLQRPEDLERPPTEAVGTVGFAAPEMLLGQSVGPAADIYALGATLYELFTGLLPHGKGTNTQYALKQVQEEVPDPRLRRPDLDPKLARITLKCLQRNPEDRYPNGTALAEALAEAQEAREETKTNASRRTASETASVNLAHTPLVLMVDDDVDILDLNRLILQESGYRVAAFSEPLAALEQFPQLDADMAILDMQMPKMDGMTLFRSIRAKPEGKDLGVLIYSGADQPDLIYSALQAGVNDYLIKPVDPDALVERVELLCRLRAMRRESQEVEARLNRLKRKSEG
ncbi:MAG: hypothetical protein AMXMBFR7_51420 [Planctomycetota bacterium]